MYALVGCSQVARANDYIGYVLSQRLNQRVTVDATHFREDLSIVDVPEVRSRSLDETNIWGADNPL